MTIPSRSPCCSSAPRRSSPDNELVSRFPDGRIHRYRYADFARRTRKLANALATLGIEPGDRVATLCWNEHRHLELYFAVPLSGAVVHTLNARLHADELTYIVNDAADRALFVHSSLLEAFEEIRDRVSVEHVIVIPDDGPTPEGYRDYEELIADEPEAFEPPPLDERQASGMCHTSGTTGRPKGVLYSHRSTSLLAMMSCMTDTVGVHERDSILPVVPMYHANAWGLPYAATYAGAKQVFPGRDLSAESLLRLFTDEGVTLTGGVPTVFLDVLRMLDDRPGEWDLSSMRSMLIGGSAAPPSLIEGFDRHGLHVTHAWGMTEMNPLGSIGNLKRAHDGLDAEGTLAARARQGHAQPLIQFRHVSEDGTVQPWDAEALGELQVRGPDDRARLLRRRARRRLRRRRLVPHRRHRDDRRARLDPDRRPRARRREVRRRVDQQCRTGERADGAPRRRRGRCLRRRGRALGRAPAGCRRARPACEC